LLWSHYADGHKGICLEFEVEKMDYFSQIRYVESPLHFSLQQFETSDKKVNQNIMIDMFYSKSSFWSYEDEIRIFARREHTDTNLVFKNFKSMNIKLSKIILGCKMSHTEVNQIRNEFRDLNITEALLRPC